VHRINAHAEQKVVQAFISDYRRVTGKENILFKITEAAVGAPGGLVRDDGGGDARQEHRVRSVRSGDGSRDLFP